MENFSKTYNDLFLSTFRMSIREISYSAYKRHYLYITRYIEGILVSKSLRLNDHLKKRRHKEPAPLVKEERVTD